MTPGLKAEFALGIPCTLVTRFTITLDSLVGTIGLDNISLKIVFGNVNNVSIYNVQRLKDSKTVSAGSTDMGSGKI